MKKLILSFVLFLALAPSAFAASSIDGLGTSNLNVSYDNDACSYLPDGTLFDYNGQPDPWVFNIETLRMYSSFDFVTFDEEPIRYLAVPSYGNCTGKTYSQMVDDGGEPIGEVAGYTVRDDVWDTYDSPVPPPDPGEYAPVSGVVWAMSALSIFMVIIFVYLLIFFMILYAIFWGIIQVFKPIFQIITYGD